MIDVRQTWLPQIISYANLITDTDVLWHSWVDGDRSRTSVSDYDELIEQIFGDLDSTHMLTVAKAEISENLPLVSSIQVFLHELERFDRFHGVRSELADSAKLLQSAEWNAVKIAAVNVLRVLP